MISLNEALEQIALYLDLNAEELKAYADEDTVGGYHTSKAQSKWPMGSLWEVEGKVLYALVRALKPKRVLEVGSYYGASTTHIAEALLKNDNGQMTCIDIAYMSSVPKKYEKIIKRVERDLMDYTFPTKPRFDFVFEDADHQIEQVAHIWEQFKKKGSKNAVIVSHDAMHFVVGQTVKAGIETVTRDYETYLIKPSDCGLALWRKE